MKKVKKKSLNIGVSRYLPPSPFGEGLGVRLWVSRYLLPSPFGEGLGVRFLFRYIVAVLLLVVGVGQEAHAQYVITKETARCLTKQDSLLSDNFGQKVDGQLRSSYRADTVSLIDKYFRRGYVEKGHTDDS